VQKCRICAAYTVESKAVPILTISFSRNFVIQCRKTIATGLELQLNCCLSLSSAMFPIRETWVVLCATCIYKFLVQDSRTSFLYKKRGSSAKGFSVHQTEQWTLAQQCHRLNICVNRIFCWRYKHLRANSPTVFPCIWSFDVIIQRAFHFTRLSSSTD